MNNLQDRIRGCFLGIAIGDALGKAVETMTAKEIKEKYGRITDYVSNSEHKWFSADKKGTTTDDWQLTKATAQGFIYTGEFNMGAIAAEHHKEFLVSVAGWGASTRESIANIADGMNWKESGKTDKPNRGTGNGVCMKAAPIGIYMHMLNPQCANPRWNEDINKIVEFSAMTHRTSIAVTSGLAHVFATMKCLSSNPKNFNKKSFIEVVTGAASMGKQFFPETLKDDMGNRFEKLKESTEWNEDKIIEEFGGGTCYVYDSLPFTYAFFLREPLSIESLYDCVSAGGDTDSNGSQLAGLLGALHGTSIFPKHLVDGLVEREEVLAVADKFYERLAALQK